MKQVISVRSHAVPAFSGVTYTELTCPPTNGGSGEYDVTCPWPADGTFRNFIVKLDAPPGAGTSLKFTVRKNGVDTAVECTISGTDVTARDVSNSFAVSPGDELSVKITPTGSPASPGSPGLQFSIEFEGSNANESGYAWGGTQTNNGTNRNALLCGNYSGWTTAAGSTVENVVAADGVISAYYVQLHADSIDAGGEIYFHIYKNGVKQDGTGGTVNTGITFTNADGLKKSAAFSLTAAPGDRFYIERSNTAANTYASNVRVGVRFVATTDGESQICGIGNELHTTLPAFNQPQNDRGLIWSGNESIRSVIGGVTSFLLGKMQVRTDGAPGASRSYTFDVRRNGTSPAGTPTVVIADAAVSGSDLIGGVSISDGFEFAIQSVPSGTPTDRLATWALVQNTAAAAIENTPPIVDAGEDQTIQLPDEDTVDLLGTVSDDGLPDPPAAVTYLWTKESGPGTVAFGDDTALSTTATFSAPGTYVLRLTASDSELSAYDELTVTVEVASINPCTGGGEVEIGEDPVDGEALASSRTPLLWVNLHLDSGDLPIAALPLPDPSTYHGGHKRPRLISIGRPRLAASDQFGGLQTSDIELLIIDTDRAFRTRMRAETMINRTFDVWIADDAVRRAQGEAKRRGHYVITNVEPIGDMTFRVRGSDFIGSELSRFFSERQLIDRRLSRTTFPQLPVSMIGKVEPGYYGWIGDDSLATLEEDPVELDESQGYGGIDDGGFIDFGWAPIGGLAPVDLSLSEAAGGTFMTGDTVYVLRTAVVGGVETDPFPMTDGAGQSFTFTADDQKLVLDGSDVAGATAYRWYVSKNAQWGHTASPPDARVRTETATSNAELTDAGNENVGPWPPPDTDWEGTFGGPMFVVVIARYADGITPRQVNAGYVKLGPWETRLVRVGWIPPGDEPLEYWVITLVGNTYANKYIVAGTEDHLDLNLATTPDEIINGTFVQEGAIPLPYVGDEVIGGVAYRTFLASLGVIRLNALHGSDEGTPATRVRLDDSVYGSTFLVPGKTGWPFATLYRPSIDEAGDLVWYTLVYGLSGNAIVEAAVDGTVPLTANTCGFAEDSRGVDDDDNPSPTIDALADQCLHFLENFGNPQDGKVWKSGPWKSPHTRNGVCVHRGSAFQVAKAYAATLTSGGFKGAWGFAVDGASFSLDAWLRAAAINHDWRWNVNEHGQLEPLMVNPSAAAVAAFSDGSVLGTAPANIPDHAPVKILPSTQNLINRIRYVYKKNYVQSVTKPTPAEDVLLPPKLSEVIDWYSGTIVENNDLSQRSHGGADLLDPDDPRRLIKPLEMQFSMHRTSAGPAVIVARYLERWGFPPEVVLFPASLLGCDVKNGQVVNWTHHAGAGSAGAVDRRLWLISSELEATLVPGDPTSLDVWLEGEDITRLYVLGGLEDEDVMLGNLGDEVSSEPPPVGAFPLGEG